MLLDRLLANYEQKVISLSLRSTKQEDRYHTQKDQLADALRCSRSSLLVGLLCGGIGVVALVKYASWRAGTSWPRCVGHFVLRQIDKSF